ncbi:(2Fe-2S)-binding protein [Natronoglycomyces albus]|uniref:Bacterioferritin-associated ferredoxin n=1 Tax=Natronoglycomyces albus TaxID=2811108 RepID=A0A895XST4_9ACTN|nr:(2Fe-2S)-binding protein [Natronoglycomyces albus]
MYACICHGVREHEVQECISAGATDEDAIGDACGAGTGCGTCLDRLTEMIESHFAAMDSQAGLSYIPDSATMPDSIAPVSPAVRLADSPYAGLS